MNKRLLTNIEIGATYKDYEGVKDILWVHEVFLKDIAEAQDAKTREMTLKEVGEWLEEYIKNDIAMHYDFGGDDEKRFAVFALEWKIIDALKQGKL